MGSHHHSGCALLIQGKETAKQNSDSPSKLLFTNIEPIPLLEFQQEAKQTKSISRIELPSRLKFLVNCSYLI